MKYNQILFSLFIYTLYEELNYRSNQSMICTLDGSNDADSCKCTPFEVSLILLPVGGQIQPPHPKKTWGVTKHFKAKHT